MYPYIKRILDFVLSLLAILVLSLFMLIIALMIKVESRGPVFFSQKRVGKNNRHFYLYKFRTMRTDTPKDVPTHLLENPSGYITKIGAFLRRTSLDELPQLINIIRGDMSIVGPRPALWNQYDLIALRDAYDVNKLFPGLTGWAQVNGRDELPVVVKAGYDREYKEKMSFSFDVKIVVLTVSRVFNGDGIREGTRNKNGR